MSILLRGMKMPKDREIILRVDEKGEVYVYGSYPTEIHEAVELPDHGDLSDKNIIVDELNRRSKDVSEMQKGVKDERTISYCQGVMVGYESSIMALNGASVVIPAERSD